MGKNSQNRKEFRNKLRLHWAPVLRAVRDFTINARQAELDNKASVLRDPTVKQAARQLMQAAHTWHTGWEAQRMTSGRGFTMPDGPLQAPKDPFHRIQRACKSYGYSLRAGADRTEKTQALMELLNAALAAPIGQGVFSASYSDEAKCRELLITKPGPEPGPEPTHEPKDPPARPRNHKPGTRQEAVERECDTTQTK